MKSLRFAVQVIAFLVIIVLLAGLSINLIGTWPLETTTLSNVTPVVASPTAEPQKPPSIERAATSTSTPRVYFATPILGPTYTPTPIPTPMEVVEAGQSVGGYTFSEARLVPGTMPHNIELFDQLPDNPNKVLIVRDGVILEIIDINTGESQVYHQAETLITDAVWLPDSQTIAYLVSDAENFTKQYLYISNEQQIDEKPSPVFTTTLSPLASTPDGSGVILFDTNWQLTQIEPLNTQFGKPLINIQAYAPTSYKHSDMYQIAQSANRNKFIYYNDDWTLLVDFNIDSVIPIDLEALRTENMPPIDHVQDAVWSPEGDRVALLIAAGGMYDGNNLFILDITSNTLSYIENDFHFIYSLAWSPDSKQILILSAIGLSGESTGGLFLIDLLSKNIRSISVLPQQAVVGTTRNLIWSPNGQSIVIRFADKPFNPGLYIIEAKSNNQ